MTRATWIDQYNVVHAVMLSEEPGALRTVHAVCMTYVGRTGVDHARKNADKNRVVTCVWCLTGVRREEDPEW